MVVATRAVAARASADSTTRRFERLRLLDRECGEVTAAILLASRKRTTRIVVCNLRHAPVVAQALRGLASQVGVRLVLMPRPDAPHADIAIESD
jgi:hypothetical protein